MWNRKREAEYTPKVASTPPTSTDLSREGIPMSTIPTRSMEPESARGAASIGKSVLIKGQILSREDLYIDGEVDGSVEMQEHRLTVGPNGKVHAGIKVREIVVLGTVQGNVEASDKIDIRKDAKLVGDIKTARIVIEDGAYFKGSIDIVKPEPAKPAPKPAVPAAAPPQAPVQAPLPAGVADGKR
jgi:cytoskeletal protein CcmA (bactofilin family)